MPVISRALSVAIRLGEIAFATIVAGIIGFYLNQVDDDDVSPQDQWIYVEVVAAISLLLSLLWLIPFAHSFFVWPVDLIISLAWFAAFGVLVNTIDPFPCDAPFISFNFGFESDCNRLKTAEAFAFLSAILWLVSSFLGIWFVWRVERNNHRFYGRYQV